jgi:hypothetical protein
MVADCIHVLANIDEVILLCIKFKVAIFSGRKTLKLTPHYLLRLQVR